jgi:dienelactone hydrolase
MLCCAVGVLGGDALAASPTLVEFEGASHPLGTLQQRLARERGEIPKDIPGDRLQGYLAKPDGNGPFPAVVGLHGCGGLHEAAVQSASERLWTPAKDCVRTVARWGSAGPPIELVTYPGAYHDFDVLQPSRTFFDHWLEYNADAADDAYRRIREFLTHQLGK